MVGFAPYPSWNGDVVGVVFERSIEGGHPGKGGGLLVSSGCVSKLVFGDSCEVCGVDGGLCFFYEAAIYVESSSIVGAGIVYYVGDRDASGVDGVSYGSNGGREVAILGCE